ncbi:hypothetical protein [Deinococcus sp. UYEF24]
MSALAIRRLITEALAKGEIQVGTAHFQSGDETAAINVGDWPEGTTVHGLEVLIASTPRPVQLDSSAYLGSIPNWPVRLVNWSGTANLEDVVNAVAEAFYPFGEDPRVLEASPDYPEQVTFTVIDYTSQED